MSDIHVVRDADSCPYVYARWDLALHCQLVHGTLEGWFAVAPGAMLGRHLREVWGEERFAQESAFVDAVLAGQPHTLAWRVEAVDGTHRSALNFYAPDEVGGKVVGFWTCTIDLTPFKRIEADLRDESHRRASEHAALERAQRLGQFGGWEWHGQSGTSAWSQQMYAIVGCMPDRTPPGREELRRYCTPAGWRRLTSAARRAVVAGTSFALELELVCADGSLRWLDVRGERAQPDHESVATHLCGIAHDITDRKQAELALARSQDFLARTGALAGIGGWELDLQTRAIYWSPEVCMLHGEAPGFRPTLDRALGYYTEASRPIVASAVAIAVAGGSDYDLEVEIVRSDGARRWVRVVGSVQRLNGRPFRLTGVFQDITARRQLAQRLEAQYETMRITLHSMGEAVITTDADAAVTWLNPVAEGMTGWTAAEAIGRPLGDVFEIVHQDTGQPLPNPAEACLRAEAASGLAGAAVLLSHTGAEYGIENSASPIRSATGQLLGSVLVFHDVTEQRRQSTQKNKIDALTKLMNRQAFEDCLQHTLSRALVDHSEHALLLIDLDQFKLVNDVGGHSTGDLMLRRVATLLSEAARTGDVLARTGGDEFAVILQDCGIDTALQLAEQLRERLDSVRLVHDEKRFRIGASIGLVPLDRRWNGTTAVVMQAADACCYAAKEAGRNRVYAWSETDALVHARHDEMQWATRLEHALDEDRFVLFAQRIFPTDEGVHKLHAEVLIRLRNTDGSLVQPGAFLPAAERFHLASRIDRWVLRNVIALLQSDADLSRIDSLCVNLSGQSIGDRAFHRQAMEKFTRAGPAVCRCICLEITETAAITNMKDAMDFIRQVRDLGIRIALDDFGAGASTFGYLRSLAVDKLKIDGQFVTDIVVNALDEAAVRCFVDVARVVKVKTIAEFVDKPEVLARIRALGVDFAQGFLMHRPEPIEHVLWGSDACKPLA